MQKQFKKETVEKYLGFLHMLKAHLTWGDDAEKITNFTKKAGVASVVPSTLVEMKVLKRVGRGKYEWIAGMPDMAMVEELLTQLFAPGPNAQNRSLEARVEELETLVLRLMEDVQCLSRATHPS